MLALLLDERGAEQVEQTLERAAIHAVNFAEVVTELVRKGVPPDQAREAEADLAIQVLEEFTLEQARLRGSFTRRPATAASPSATRFVSP
jgi:PIN domain nuclease of toxin-antitoxin system